MEGPTELWGVKVPAPEEGVLRLGYERTVFTIHPHLDDYGFELKYLTSSRLSRAAHMFPGMMTRELQNTLEEFSRFLLSPAGEQECSWRSSFSEQQRFYQQVRRHLEEFRNPTRSRAMSSLQGLSATTHFKELSCLIP